MLTSCDAFDHFPPGILQPFIQASRVSHPAAFRAALQPLRTSVVRRRAYGALSKGDIDHLVAEWVRPALSDPRIADDLRRFTASLKQRDSTEAATRLANYGKPALVVVGGRQVLPDRGRPPARLDAAGRALRADRGIAHVLDARSAGRPRGPHRGCRCHVAILASMSTREEGRQRLRS